MTKLYPYQREGVNTMIRTFHRRALLGDEMGLGKSIQALKASIPPVVIVCPASLKWNWEREVVTHVGVRGHVLEGRMPSKIRLNPKVLIINYDILGDWLKFIPKPQTVILDECQDIKNRDTLKYKSVKKLIRGVPNLLALSGSPLDRPIDLFPVLNLLNPKVFPSVREYGQRFCGPERRPWGWEYKGATHMAELHTLLHSTCMIRRLKKDVLQDLPPKTRTIVPLVFDKARRDEYEYAQDEFLAWLREHKPGKGSNVRKAMGLAKITYLKGLVAKMKLKYVREWRDEFLRSTNEKLITFGYHKQMLQRLQHDQSVLVNGSVTGRKRMAAVDAFQNQTNVREFIGQIHAAGKGLNLTAASNVALIELWWTSTAMNQCEDRADRIGQHYPVTCHYLIAKDTIEERICKLLQHKQRVTDEVLDGHPVQNFNLFNALLEEYDEYAKQR